MFTALTVQALLILVPAPREKEGADKGPGYLGITYEQEGDTFIITEIHKDSPAKKAGLMVGDQILRFDGKKYDSVESFVRQIVRTRPGTVVETEVMRGSEKKIIKVKIGVRPEDFPFPLPMPDDQPLEQLPSKKEQ